MRTAILWSSHEGTKRRELGHVILYPDKLIRELDANYPLRVHCLLAGQSYNDQSTQNVFIDFQQTPHVLVATAAGKKKSMSMAVGLISLCEQNSPDGLVVHLIGV